MKICVYFQPRTDLDNFEGARLRKSVKSALELKNIAYAKNIIDSYNLIHFFSLDDELKILDASRDKIPTVYSALLCETDKTTRIFDLKNGEYVADARIRVLNKIDLILVSDKVSKDALIKQGITSKIEIVPVGVKISRFYLKDCFEDDLFNKNFQIDDSTRFVVTIGTYEDKDKFESLMKIAALCPQYTFFYFGMTRKKKKPYKNKRIPSNLRFYPLADEELYVSMLKKAALYLSFDNRRHNPITLLDVAASKTQIVAMAPLYPNEEILKQMDPYIGKDEEEVAALITNLMEDKLPLRVEKAFKVAQENSIDKLGDKLVDLYEKLIKEKAKND